MMAVIFEVQPAPGQQDAYLQAAAALRPLLEQVDGFISIERFQSLTEPSRLLSLSFWRDEEAVAQANLGCGSLAREQQARCAQECGKRFLERSDWNDFHESTSSSDTKKNCE